MGPSKRLKQAVILAGGRGSRLRPITDLIPKPMIRFHGKPFMEYLLEMLREQGIEQVLMLLGYKAEAIQEHFGDGRRWGLDIDYSVSAEEHETGRRLKLAQHKIDRHFLLMYCDNYWPLQLDAMWQRFQDHEALAMVTVYRNPDGYCGNNIRLDAEGYVAAYDKTRTTLSLQGNDIGFAVLDNVLLDSLTDENLSFEATTYPRLVGRHELLAFPTDHRYYSVGSIERLPLTEQFLARRPTVIVDRDGVLNHKPPAAHYVRNWDEFQWLPGAKDALRLFKQADYRVVVVTNQAGIARGAMTDRDLADIHQRMVSDVAEAGGRIDRIYHCPHGWDDGCQCRKPRPGMLLDAQRDLDLDLSRTVFIGDDERDQMAAEAAGCQSLLVKPGTALLDLAHEMVSVEAGVH